MKLITCASYYATGSSAVTDFFTEFENVVSLGRYEYRFVWDPDGISDLEYNIVENNNRHNTGYAIKRYLKMTNQFNSFGYGGGYRIFNNEFKRFTEQYINEITELKTLSWWHRERIDRGSVFCFWDRGYSYIKRLLNGGLNTQKRYSLLQKKEIGYFSAISEEKFLNATKKYTDAVFNYANKSGAEYMMADQLVPATNIDRYLRYFSDIRVIVVERDPRDLFLIEQNLHRGVVPIGSVEDYVKWFRITRTYSKPKVENEKCILRINFEDIIYNYEDTTKKMAEFVGLSLDKHVYPLKNLNPSISIKNTNLKNSIKGYEKEIDYIEKNLSEYLFDFEKYSENGRND